MAQSQKKSAWDDILKFKGQEANTIIAGDFNAHHNGWNCINIDRNGENLYATMYKNGYICINNDTKSRMGYNNQTASNLDLIFANNDLIDIIDYQQNEDSWESDHYPIRINIDIYTQRYQKRTNRKSSVKTRVQLKLGVWRVDEEMRHKNFKLLA